MGDLFLFSQILTVFPSSPQTSEITKDKTEELKMSWQQKQKAFNRLKK